MYKKKFPLRGNTKELLLCSHKSEPNFYLYYPLSLYPEINHFVSTKKITFPIEESAAKLWILPFSLPLLPQPNQTYQHGFSRQPIPD